MPLRLIHYAVAQGVRLHDEVQVVVGGHQIHLQGQLLRVGLHHPHKALQLGFGGAVAPQAPDLLDGHAHGVPPAAGVRDHVERRHCAALAARVGVVELDRDERWRGGCVSLVQGRDPELDHGHHQPRDDGVPKPAVRADADRRGLGEQGELEGLEHGMLEHEGRGRLHARHLALAGEEMRHPGPLMLHGRRGGPRLKRVRHAGHLQLGGGAGERVEDLALHLRRVHVAHHVEGRVGGKVVARVVGAHRVARPRLDLLLFADGEAVAEGVLQVQPLQKLAVYAVLDRVHHLQLGEHRLALLLDALREKGRGEGDLVQRVQGQLGHVLPARALHGGVHVEDRVVEVRVGVGARARTEQQLPLPAPQEHHVLHQVRDPLLVLLLVDGAGVDLQVRLEASGRHWVGQHHVPQAIGERASAQLRVRGQRLVQVPYGRHRRRVHGQRRVLLPAGRCRGGGRGAHEAPLKAGPSAPPRGSWQPYGRAQGGSRRRQENGGLALDRRRC
mmetsp:Transcript_4151/g.14870  ORF Transcript_4151/g.14870 Transcript_4151/m.14870 type:complete len:500 (+) Transcript_4151:2091-3590(+)